MYKELSVLESLYVWIVKQLLGEHVVIIDEEGEVAYD